MNALEIKNISKAFKSGRKKIFAVEDLSFTVNKGEAYGFIGANGAGKSTTIKIMMDILKADSGTILINDVDSKSYLSRKGVSYVPESPYLYDYLTPIELLKLGVQQHKVKADELERYCMNWLDKFDIAHAAKKRIRSLSKGMTQRTALAHALACKPDFLILDEPLSGLDPVGRRDVVDILVEYRKQGGTLFFTSHVLFDVERVADRFGLIHKGKMVIEKTASDLFAESSGQFVIQIEAESPLKAYEHEMGNRYNLNCNREQLWNTLKKVEDAKHSILSVKPQLTLETAFFEYIGKVDSNN